MCGEARSKSVGNPSRLSSHTQKKLESKLWALDDKPKNVHFIANKELRTWKKRKRKNLVQPGLRENEFSLFSLHEFYIGDMSDSL